jgi:hypothetical protein
MAGWHKSCRAQDQRSGRTFRWDQWNTSAGAPGPDKSLPPFNSDQNRQEIREVNRKEKRRHTDTHKKKWGELTRRASISSRVQESLGAYRSCTTKRITVINTRDGNQCQFSRRQEPLTIRLAVTFVHDWRGLIGLIGWSLQASLSLIKMTIRVFAACKTRHLSVAVSLLFRFPSLQTFSPQDIGFVWILVPSTDNLLVLNSTVLIYGTNSVPLRDFHPLWSS